MFEANGSTMVFWQSLQPHPKEGNAQFVRGITAVGDYHICIGKILYVCFFPVNVPFNYSKMVGCW